MTLASSTFYLRVRRFNLISKWIVMSPLRNLNWKSPYEMSLKATSRKDAGHRFVYNFSSSLFLIGSKLLFKLFSLLISRPIRPFLPLSLSLSVCQRFPFSFTGHSLLFRSFFVNLIWLSVKIPVDLFLESSQQLHLPQSNPLRDHFT